MTKAKVYNFRKANYEGMKQRLTEVDWSKIEKTSTEKGWLFFKNVVLEAQNNYIPKVDKSKSKTKWPKWFNRSIKKNIQRKKALYRAFKRDQKQSTLSLRVKPTILISCCLGLNINNPLTGRYHTQFQNIFPIL